LDSVRILVNDREAKLVFDDMRREMLRLLAKEALTARRLATILGLSSPTVGHHLEVLKRSGFVEIVGMEAEAHGIIQKFYRATAQAYIIETRKLSPIVKRYFMPSRIERTRGMVAALSLNSGEEYKSSSRGVETASEELGRYILEAAERRQGPAAETDPETVINGMYREALENLLISRPNIFPRVSYMEVEGLRQRTDQPASDL
jgi:DNA-binding transcriptional ArsR family regulator